MTNALSIFKTNDLTKAEKKARVAALKSSAAQNTQGSGSEMVFLKFAGQGSNYRGWAIGRDGETPDEDAIYVIDVEYFVEGWICWKGGKPVARKEWSLYERDTKAVAAEDLEDHGPYDDGEGWQFLMGCSMFNVDKPGTRIVFHTSTVSGRDTMGKLFDEVGSRTEADEPFVPVVKLSDQMFEARGKKNGKPIFLFEGWVNPSDVHKFLTEDGATVDQLLAG